MEALFVVHQVLPALLVGEPTQLRVVVDALPVAQVVISADHVAVVREKAGKCVVAGYILRHAVDQLDHGFDLALRLPEAAVDVVDAVGGGKCKIADFTHSNTPSCVI